MNLGRIWTVAANGFQETIRDRILYIILFFALLLGLATRLLPEISGGMSDKILLDFGLAALSLFSAIVAIFVATGLINKEIDKRTILVMIPKPITRAEFIVGKHFGVWAVLTVMAVAMSLITLGFFAWSRVPYPLPTVALSIVYLLLELGVLVATALLFGVFTDNILAMSLSLGVYLVGHFSSDLVRLGKLGENGAIQTLTQGIYVILPNLSRLNLRNEAVYGVLPSTGDLLGNALYGVAYMIVLLAIAVLIFSRRQF
ncbi:ABC transporter permease [Spirulina sp. CS-785/01]|uniref:ABC transporter permease n=1 Tax=Spirulina sp. CS-785/01 TaxID=3021716 RepID=UPI002330A55D|nr:ABC transporter permease [Spirulina sp. CS-785/01]